MNAKVTHKYFVKGLGGANQVIRASLKFAMDNNMVVFEVMISRQDFSHFGEGYDTMVIIDLVSMPVMERLIAQKSIDDIPF